MAVPPGLHSSASQASCLRMQCLAPQWLSYQMLRSHSEAIASSVLSVASSAYVERQGA